MQSSVRSNVTIVAVVALLVIPCGAVFADTTVSPSPFWKNTIQFPNDPFRNAPDGDDGISWVKFTILTCDPTTVYFQDSNSYVFHYNFATEVLDPFLGFSLEEYNNVSLFAEGQQAILGVVLIPPYLNNFPPVPDFPEYGIQFVRQDPFTAQEIVDLFNVVKANVIADPGIDAIYFPTFEQQAVADANLDFFESNGVQVGSASRWAEGNACYSQGWALGELKFVTANQIDNAFLSGALKPDDILLTDGVPAEIPSVAGVISLAPSTPNSHVAILAKTFNLPFVHFALQEDADRALSLVGRKVVFRAFDRFGQCDIRLIDVQDVLTPQQITEILALKAPPALDIAAKTTLGGFSASTDSLNASDVQFFGGKASNFGLLRRAIPDKSPVAAALSFDLWDAFLDQILVTTGNTLRQEINQRLSGYTYPPDFQMLANDLDDIRDMIKDDTVFAPALQNAIISMLQDPQFGFDIGAKIRFRSSTNVEDSEQFTGAGLYESRSGCLPDDLDADDIGPSFCDPTENNERGVFRAIRRVFASFYNDNAFIERLRHGVDESEVGMAVLVHHSFPDEFELANGVATLTKTQSLASYEILLVTQDGAVSVTNPVGGAIPEEVEVRVSANNGFVHPPTFLAPSNLVLLGEQVMDWPNDYKNLAGLLADVAEQFELETGKTDYILDFEYKKLAPGGAAIPAGGLVVKQVREIPQGDSTPSITPFLLNIPTDYQSEGGRSYKSLGNRWQLETKTMWLTPENLASESIFTNVVLETTTGCRPIILSGPMSSLPGATHGYDEINGHTTDTWEVSDIPSPRTYTLKVDNLGLVAPNENPILTPRDLGANGRLLLTVDYDTPIPITAGSTTLISSASDFVSPKVEPPNDTFERNRQYDLPGGGMITTQFIAVQPFSCCQIVGPNLVEMIETVIEGLTTEPVVLRSVFAHTWSSGQHAKSETAVFEPMLEFGLSPRTLDELDAMDIRMIHVFAERQMIMIGEDPLPPVITYYGAQDLGLDCDPCHDLVVGDLTGDRIMDGRDIERFVGVLVEGPTGPRETCAADIDGDTFVDMGDLPSFVDSVLNDN